MNHKVVHLGMYTALALIFSYIECLIPFHIGIPGIKLGLANLIVVVVLYKMGWKEAYIISITRVLLASILFGNLASISFSMAGCLLSLTMMCMLYRVGSFSIMGVSIIGAVFHNLGQILMAIFVVSNVHVAYYFPVLMIAGVITGLLIGLVAREMLVRIKG